MSVVCGKCDCIKDGVFIDDGATGVNFNRSEFERLINDIEQGLVGSVVVKDVSRFGRNQTMAGYYIDVIFPSYDVDFVSVLEPDKDFLPLHHFINELYAKDISKKIRSVVKHKGNSGGRLCSNPPYGYIKDSNDKKKWIVDATAAEIVKVIFNLYVNENYGMYMIAEYLKMNNVPTPSEYCGNRRRFPKTPHAWSVSTVSNILANQCYCGDTVNFKTGKKSFKEKTKIFYAPKTIKYF